jgi:hypothetical protein
MTDLSTQRITRLMDRTAERYDAAEPWERRLVGPDARRIAGGAGNVLELAIGTAGTFRSTAPTSASPAST